VAEALVKRLSLYRLRRKIAIAIAPELGVYWEAMGDGGAADPRLAALGQRWIAAVADDDGGGCAMARTPPQAGRARRAELGSDQTLWLETNAAELNVSFTKGCYVGQENTARMNWRQRSTAASRSFPSPSQTRPASAWPIRPRPGGGSSADRSDYPCTHWLEDALEAD
jgi:folate-binding protein YgfZ